MRNKMRLRNKFKNKFKKNEEIKMKQIRKTLLKDLEEIQKRPRRPKKNKVMSEQDYSFF
ncbi:hypothetical protein [Helicobacter sp. MIT 11-5569]|uniref:hypothetical protein n=1 Tax=Helicobacter sp. MIT 11-5569 TaxID=1548151 RepID=UPI000AB80FBC|nr:hypothetical protein [Helicobacter sp. MIT 11-5569]